MLTWLCRGRRIDLSSRPCVLGILNVTPDSFSDGGRYLDPAAAVAHAEKLIADGADMLDIGGESTRPGAEPVAVDEELHRVIPVVRELAKRTDVPISVDTMKPVVAREALAAGASVVNDVGGFRDPAMIAAAVEHQAGVIVMHMQGTPATMQANPAYADVVREVSDFLADRTKALTDAGLSEESVAIDPGIGFGKTMDHNLTLLANLAAFRRLNRPLCLGVSRKGTLGTLTGRDRGERMAGSLAVACFGVAAGAVQIIRTHDVGPTRDAAVLWDAISKHRT
jgi:dihydropteroate synthase